LQTETKTLETINNLLNNDNLEDSGDISKIYLNVLKEVDTIDEEIKRYEYEDIEEN